MVSQNLNQISRTSHSRLAIISESCSCHHHHRHHHNSFSIFGAKLWNCLKPDLRKLRKQPFKNKIHQFILVVLGNEDDYVDVSTLMLKITNYH